MSSACHTASESNTVIHKIINVYIHRRTNRSLCFLGSQYYWLSVWGFFTQMTNLNSNWPKNQGFILKQMLKFPGKIHSWWKFRVFSINNTWLSVICLPVDFTQVRKDSKIAGGNHFSLAQLLNSEISVENECYFLLWERWSRDTLSDFNLQLYRNQTFSIACFMTATRTVEWNRLLV